MKGTAIKYVNSVFLIEEMQTDGHSPMKFLCDDDKVYFCKYRSGHSLNPKEIDFLAYEIVCHFLLKFLNIPTPEIALVQLNEDSFSPKDLIVNRKYARPGVVCFGSREIPNSNLISGLELVKTRRDFNQYLNAEDLIRIAYFDLWVANTDRGRDENYNLLAHFYLGKTRIVAFDHAFAFYGQNGIGAFNPRWLQPAHLSLTNTPFFQAQMRFIPKKDRKTIIEKVVDWNVENAKNAIDNAFSAIPASWQVSPKLKDRVLGLLLDRPRLETIKTELLLMTLKAKR